MKLSNQVSGNKVNSEHTMQITHHTNNKCFIFCPNKKL